MSAPVRQDAAAPVSGCEATSKDRGRRAFLATAVAAVTAALSAEWWTRWRVPVVESLVPTPIAGAADLAADKALSFALPGSNVQGILIRLADGGYAAFDRRCPHLGCPVMWDAEKAQLECPCHAAMFEASTGRVLAGPPPHGLRRLEVEQRDGELWVRKIAAPVEFAERGTNTRRHGEVDDACT